MKKSLLFICLCLSLIACNTSKQIVYLQNITYGDTTRVDQPPSIKIQCKDMISIVVSSKDPELAALVNLPIVSHQAFQGAIAAPTSQRISGYTVDEKGQIDFPILGKITIAGLTRSEVSEMIKGRLIHEEIIQDPVVTVEFMNLYISILGEVKNPGRYTINRDQISIFEAISLSGDLTIHGKRDGVIIIRDENGVSVNYRLDLRSSEIFDSPVYYLQQNDIIYVQPNKVRAGQSTINENSLKSVSLWVSLATLATTVTSVSISISAASK